LPTKNEIDGNFRKFGFDIILETKQAKGQKSKRDNKYYLKEKERYEAGETTRVKVRAYSDDSLIYQSILE